MVQVVFDDAQNSELSIDEIWLFISVDDVGEGICAAPLLGDNSLVPLIAADRARLDQLLPIALTIARESRKTIKLISFSSREDVMEIRPE